MNTEVRLCADSEILVDANTIKMIMFAPHHKSAGRWNMYIVDKFVDKYAELQIFPNESKKPKLRYGEIKRILNSANSSIH